MKYSVCIVLNIIKWIKSHVGGFCGCGGSEWAMGEWTVGQWKVGVTSFQKIYGFYGVKHQY